MLRLLLIRHAESIGNACGRMSGLDDDPLSQRGQHQARDLGDRLRNLGWHPTRIYSSPLRRARQTVEILRRAWQDAGADSFPAPRPDPLPEPIIDRDLAEFDNGVLRGLTWPEAQGRYPALCRSLESSWDWRPIPQAESPWAGRLRAERFLDRLLREAQGDDRLWIVSHAWLLEQAISALLGSDRTWQIMPKNAALFEFWLDLDRFRAINLPMAGQSRRINHSQGRSNPEYATLASPPLSKITHNHFNNALWQIRRFNEV